MRSLHNLVHSFRIRRVSSCAYLWIWIQYLNTPLQCGWTLASFIQVDRSHSPVMRPWMMLCEIICQIVLTGNPSDIKLTLFLSVLEPIETHVNSLGAPLLDSPIQNPCCSLIVSLNWCRRLWMTHVNKTLSNWECFLSI